MNTEGFYAKFKEMHRVAMIQGIGMFIFSIHGIYLQNRGNSKFFKLKGVPDLWWDVTAISLAFVGNFELGDIPVME